MTPKQRRRLGFTLVFWAAFWGAWLAWEAVTRG